MAREKLFRHKDPITYEELLDSLSSVFTVSNSEVLDAGRVAHYWKITKKSPQSKPRVSWIQGENVVVSFLFAESDSNNPCGGILIEPLQAPTMRDINFANCLGRVFSTDVRTAPDMLVHAELWTSLRETQFRRSIAKHSNFSTLPLVLWLQALEHSSSLMYEGKRTSLCIFMVKRQSWIVKSLGSGFVRFAKPIPFKEAILNEEWIRATIHGSRVGLLGVGRTGNIRGMVAIPEPKEGGDKNLFVPHESIRGALSLMRPGHLIFVKSMSGDIYVVLPTGDVFQKTQGRWHYLNYEKIFLILSSHYDTHLSKSIVQTILSLSYEHQGALICILNSSKDIHKIVSDHKKIGRSNSVLRSSLAGLSITQRHHRQIISSAARVDGAVVLGSNGKVLDVACMIVDPELKDVKAKGHSKIKRLPGARTTAAWKASLYGIAIKVSEDGPVTVYKDGNLIEQIG